MKKTFILLFPLLLLSGMIFSQGTFITENEAKTAAEKFYYERVQSHRQVPVHLIRAQLAAAIQNNGQIILYFFNISTGGFVGVSAYDGVNPFICYSFSGEYININQQDNFKAWIGQYERQISYLLSTKAEGDSEWNSVWKYYLQTPASSLKLFSGREVLPMLTTTWDQGTYYNDMCPEDQAGPGGHCVTGCVATALGQLVNYFRWPDTGTGSYSYGCPPYGTLSVDFSSANYDWDLMANNLDSPNPEVAELIYHFGVSVDMVYGPDGSGMYNHKAAYTLKTYFKYSPETQYIFRDSTSMDWDSLLVSHLDRKIPMYYAGWSVPDTNGHAFICDGYQGEGYYHFNWGWSGANDGYFYTDNLTPGGNMFNLAQELVINAVPDTNIYNYPVQCLGGKEIEALSGTLEDGSGPLYSYADFADCSWLITPNDSVTGITLNFHRFETEANDSLTIFDGPDSSAPRLGAFSGAEIPSPVTNSGGSMFIQFVSDGQGVAGGFLASFESSIPVYCSGMVNLNDQEGTITDGSGTWNYHNNSACLWRILPEGASSVTLYFNSFETEAGSDILTIYDLQTQQVLAEYSGTYEGGLPDPVTSLSGKMFLSFSTNPLNTAPGWSAYFESNLVNISENSERNDLVIFPNPTREFLNIHCKSEASQLVKITLSDLSGRIFYSEELYGMQEKSAQLNIKGFSPGIYFLRSVGSDGKTEYYKVIKE
jgi:hypothetical protein